MQTKAIAGLTYALDVAALRHEIISENIANIHTPKYRRKDLQFEETLQQALGQSQRLQLVGTNEKHIGARLSTGPLVQEVRTKIRQDGNNVDLEYENATLAKNTLYYQAVSTVLTSHLKMLGAAITEGRR